MHERLDHHGRCECGSANFWTGYFFAVRWFFFGVRQHAKKKPKKKQKGFYSACGKYPPRREKTFMWFCCGLWERIRQEGFVRQECSVRRLDASMEGQTAGSWRDWTASLPDRPDSWRVAGQSASQPTKKRTGPRSVGDRPPVGWGPDPKTRVVRPPPPFPASAEFH